MQIFHISVIFKAKKSKFCILLAHSNSLPNLTCRSENVSMDFSGSSLKIQNGGIVWYEKWYFSKKIQDFIIAQPLNEMFAFFDML
jgi:hypothetical protein